MIHGTANCYRYHGCRCDACHAAVRIYAAKYYQKTREQHDKPYSAYQKKWRLRPIGDGPGERKITHGYGGAVAGCKCDICRKGRSEYARTARLSKCTSLIGADLLRIVAREHRKSIPKNGYNHQHYPYRQMEVGDSFLIPCTDRDKLNWVQRTATMAWRRMAPMKFTTRRTEEGIRVWRIA